MSSALALISAMLYGVQDFFGGIFTRRASVWQVAVVGQASSAITALAYFLILGGRPATSDVLWGVLGGLGAAVGAVFLYRGLSLGAMSVVAPISAVGAALLPVLVGLALGDRPTALAWIGVAFAFPAVYLISRVKGAGPARGGIVDGILAGAGFGLFYVCLGQSRVEAGFAPIMFVHLTSVSLIIVVATVLRQDWVPRRRTALWPLIMGPLGASAAAAFLVASHDGLLSIVSVLSSLYPATTVLLAAVVLLERIERPQQVALAFAALAVGCIAVG